MLLNRAYKLHLPLSPSPIMTWRQLGVCQPKKQLHLKAISFLIAERLPSCCLAAGSHLVPGTWEWMFQAGSQPCPMPAERSWPAALPTLPGSSLYLKDLLLTQSHRLEAREAGAILCSIPSSTTHLLCDLGQVHGMPWLMFLCISKYHLLNVFHAFHSEPS